MDVIRTDRREIRAEPDPEGEELARATAAEYLDVRLRMARVLLRLDRKGTHHLSACSSIVQYACGLNIPAADARMLIDLARAVEASAAEIAPAAAGDESADAPAAEVSPSIEDLIRGGRLRVENVAIFGRLLTVPGLVRPGEDWLHRAETLPARELRRRVNERIEEAAQNETELVALSLHVTQTARAEFGRARELASREARIALTEGQAFTLVVRSYLAAHDELRRGEGARRVGPTAELPGDRYIPAAARREVLERSGDHCEVRECPHGIFLEFAHVRSHAEGGDREARNLLRLCHVHHVQFDAGVLVFLGWRDGRPVLRSANREETASDAADDELRVPIDAESGPSSLRGRRACHDENADGFGRTSLGAEEPVRSDVYDLVSDDEADDESDDDGGYDDWESRPMQVSERPPPAWTSADALGVP